MTDLDREAMEVDVVIVGAGPAGLSAAVMAGQRAEVTVVGQVDSPISESLARGIATSFATSVADTQRGLAVPVMRWLAAYTVVMTLLYTDGDVYKATGRPSVLNAVTLGQVAAADRVLDPNTFFAASMAVFFVFFMVQFGVTGLLDEEREGTLTRLQAGFNAKEAEFADGHIRAGGKSIALAELAGPGGLVAEDFIEYDKVDKTRGMEISIVTTAKSDEEGRRLLKLLGMPFQDN